MSADIIATIETAWEDRSTIGTATVGIVRDAVEAALAALDNGSARVAEPGADGQWIVNQWLKKAVLLSFRLNDNSVIEGPGGYRYEGGWVAGAKEGDGKVTYPDGAIYQGQMRAGAREGLPIKSERLEQRSNDK